MTGAERRAKLLAWYGVSQAELDSMPPWQQEMIVGRDVIMNTADLNAAVTSLRSVGGVYHYVADAVESMNRGSVENSEEGT